MRSLLHWICGFFIPFSVSIICEVVHHYQRFPTHKSETFFRALSQTRSYPSGSSILRHNAYVVKSCITLHTTCASLCSENWSQKLLAVELLWVLIFIDFAHIKWIPVTSAVDCHLHCTASATPGAGYETSTGRVLRRFQGVRTTSILWYNRKRRGFRRWRERQGYCCCCGWLDPGSYRRRQGRWQGSWRRFGGMYGSSRIDVGDYKYRGCGWKWRCLPRNGRSCARMNKYGPCCCREDYRCE